MTDVKENVKKISADIRENERYIQERCENCADILIRPMRLGDERKVDCLMVYIEVAVSNMMLDDSAIGKMINHFWEIPPEKIPEFMQNNSLGIADVQKLNDMNEVLGAVLSGNAVFFIDGYDKAMKISSRGYPNMGVSEAESEKVLRGSREGFSDSVKTNSALVRKRLRDTRMKVEEYQMGVRSNTVLQILYIDDLVHEELLEQIKERIEEYEIDGVLDSGMLEQLTEEPWYSPFPQYQVTERPDRAALELLNGKVVLLCDNSPSALILPGSFSGFMESSEDWYHHFEMASFLRILRYLALLTAMLLPGLYLAVIRFHTQILPANLLLSFAEAREGVPFTSVTELILLELAFELIREAGVRVPGALGNAIGIVGGLIIGDAAVSANLVSPIVVMIVALGNKAGHQLWQYACGIDDSPVRAQPEEAKGFSVETTFNDDIVSVEQVLPILLEQCDIVATRMRRKEKKCTSVSVTFRTLDFRNKSHQTTLANATDLTDEIYKNAKRLFVESWKGEPLRLIGVALTNLKDESFEQLSLFEDNEKKERRRKLDATMDEIRRKYGNDKIKRASIMNSNGGIARKARAQIKNEDEKE